MTSVDENKPRGLAPPCLQRVLKTAWFHILVLLLVLANAVTTATMHFDHNKIDPFDKIDNYYYVEVSIEITAIIRNICTEIQLYEYVDLMRYILCCECRYQRCSTHLCDLVFSVRLRLYSPLRQCSKSGVLVTARTSSALFTSLNSLWSWERHCTSYPASIVHSLHTCRYGSIVIKVQPQFTTAVQAYTGLHVDTCFHLQ